MKKLLLKLLLTTILCCLSLCIVTACSGSVKFKLNFIVDNNTYATIETGGEEQIAIPTNPTKEGFTFDGWYWDNGTWQQPFTANSLLNVPLSSDMSVYAKFSVNKVAGT